MASSHSLFYLPFFPAAHRGSFHLSVVLLIYIKPSQDSYSSECGWNYSNIKSTNSSGSQALMKIIGENHRTETQNIMGWKGPTELNPAPGSVQDKPKIQEVMSPSHELRHSVMALTKGGHLQALPQEVFLYIAACSHGLPPFWTELWAVYFIISSGLQKDKVVGNMHMDNFSRNTSVVATSLLWMLARFYT